MKIGLLAVQGAVEPHREKFTSLGVETSLIKHPTELETLDGLVLPGGESTAMILLLHYNELWEPLKAFVHRRPAWGICAGAILLAKKVSSPSQESLGAMDIEIERNAFGRQIDSFIAPVSPTRHWQNGEPLEAVFIRAPRIRALHGDAVPLFTYESETVAAEEGLLLASTFHPELTGSTTMHKYFLQKCEGTQRHG